MKATVKPRATFDAPLAAWFARQGWTPAPFQRTAWRHYLAGRDGLLVTPTGSGKTLAAFGGPLLQALRDPPPPKKVRGQPSAPRTRVLWISPLRALANDTTRALREPIAALDLPWTVAMRTGDASARDKRLSRTGQADVLVITPESLALLLSYPETGAQLQGLRAIVVDEWHELLGSKRGVLLQLCLARLRALAPDVRTWGLSATLGNLPEARDALLPHSPDAPIIDAAKPRSLTLETLLPDAGERFPWAGHLGLSQLQRVVARLQDVRSTLLFANTRSQAELWHKALQSVWLDDPATLALHHGSIDPKLRQAAEQGLRDGSVRCVVATSSLDLGVDFPAVDQVIQIGSPKGMARLLQRAGRARHRPGEAGHILCVPTHALELVEYAAARKALLAGRVEARVPPRLSLDVLAQHCVTLALGGGFDAGALFEEVRGTHAFAALDATTWQAVLDFIVQGGKALAHYPDYHRVVRDDAGIYRVVDRKQAFRHRLSIGTITSDGHVSVQFAKGGRLGAVEESFIGRMRPGDRFQFAGKTLELMQLKDMTAYVKLSKRNDGIVPRWQGSRMPLSSMLAEAVQATLAGPRDTPELRAVAPLLDTRRGCRRCPRRTRCWSSNFRRARAGTCSCIRSPAAPCMRAWPPCSRSAGGVCSPTRSRSRSTITAWRLLRNPDTNWTKRSSARCSPKTSCWKTCKPASISQRWRAGSSATSQGSPACFRQRCPVMRRARCASCRHPVACCSTCSRVSMPTMCCLSKRDARCSKRSWKCSRCAPRSPIACAARWCCAIRHR